MANREWVRMEQPNFCSDEVVKLVPTYNKCINVLEDYAEK